MYEQCRQAVLGKVPSVLIVAVLAAGCPSRRGDAQTSSVQPSAKTVPGGLADSNQWQKVDTGAFSVSAPAGWEFHPLQGIDSYVGRISGDGIVLEFDYGDYSNDLSEEKEPKYEVVHKLIDGLPARIIRSKTSGSGLTGVYVGMSRRRGALNLCGQNLTSAQQELALKIFETIRFAPSKPFPTFLPPPEKPQ
jgi:hypothetical protein